MPAAPLIALLRDGVPDRASSGAERVDDHRLVPWWSFGKTVLAAAALTLVDAGRLHLDDRLRGRAFTLRQLLAHRAGLPCYGSLPAYAAAVDAGQSPWPIEEMLQRTRADMFAAASGRAFAYSNVGYTLVRLLIETAADLPLGAALQRLVFDPLGLTDIVLAQTPDDLVATAWGNPNRYHPGWVYHGLLIGPAPTAALLLHRLLAGDFLPPSLLAAMRHAERVADEVPGRPWRSAHYGLGLMIGQGVPPTEYIGHTGSGPTSTAAVYQRATSIPGKPMLTAAVFAPTSHPADVESRAMQLAYSPFADDTIANGR